MRKKYIAIDGEEFKSKKKAIKHSKEVIAECFVFDYNKPVDTEGYGDRKFTSDFNDYAVNPKDTVDALYNLIDFCVDKG